MLTLPDFDDLHSILSYLHEVPFDTTRQTLYDAHSLYGFCVEEASACPSEKVAVDYLCTHDKVVYDYYMAMGKQPSDAKEALARSLHDYCITRALKAFLLGYSPTDVVGVMGGHNLKRTDPVYRQIVLLSKRLTEMGKLMVTGGGPGAMQATHVGAWMAGRTEQEVNDAMDILSQAPDFQSAEWLSSGLEVMRRFPQDKGFCSLGIPTWFYGHEPASPFATHIAKYFDNSIREDTVLTVPYGGIIFTPGSAGTLQEVFQDAVQNHYLTYGLSSPMIFLGRQFWTETMPVFPFLQSMMQTGRYQHLLLTLTDDPNEVADALLQ